MRKITSKRAAEMWCALNTWRIPNELKKAKLSEKHLLGAMAVIELFTTKTQIDRIWRSEFARNAAKDKASRPIKRA